MLGTTTRDAELFIIKMRWVLILGSPLVFWLNRSQSFKIIMYITVLASFYNVWAYYLTYYRDNRKLQLYVYSFVDLLYVSALFFYGFGTPFDLHQFYYFLILVLGIRFGMRNYYGLVVFFGLIYFVIARWSGRALPFYPAVIHDLLQVTYFIIFGILTSFLLLRERLQHEEKEELITELQAAYEQLCIYNAQVEELAITDSLTGIYNYRYFMHRLRQEMEKSRRYGRRLSLIIFDIDNFKVFNDTYGHPAGDVALKETARVFGENIRDIDTLARYGGEEFLVLLPEAGTDEAFIVAERIRSAVENHIFKMDEDSPALNVTVSGGIATFPHNGDTAENLLKKADDILYLAKNTGRNIICRP